MDAVIFAAIGIVALVFMLLWVRSSLVAKDYRIEAQNLAHDRSQIRYKVVRSIELIGVGKAKEAREILLTLAPEFKGVCGGCEKARLMNYTYCPVCGKRVPVQPKVKILVPPRVKVQPVTQTRRGS